MEAVDVIDAAHTTKDLRLYDGVAYELGTVVGPVRRRERWPRR